MTWRRDRSICNLQSPLWNWSGYRWLSLAASVAVLLLAAQLVGCAPGGASGAGSVIAVDLQALPAAVNFDARPGPDGLEVMVYLYEQQRPQPAEANGIIEFLMYDGKIPQDKLMTAGPMQAWSFGPAQLVGARSKGLAGTGYAFQLSWKQVPAGNRVTVLARYTPIAGEPIYSAPVAISVERP